MISPKDRKKATQPNKKIIMKKNKQFQQPDKTKEQ